MFEEDFVTLPLPRSRSQDLFTREHYESVRVNKYVFGYFGSLVQRLVKGIPAVQCLQVKSLNCSIAFEQGDRP